MKDKFIVENLKMVRNREEEGLKIVIIIMCMKEILMKILFKALACIRATMHLSYCILVILRKVSLMVLGF